MSANIPFPKPAAVTVPAECPPDFTEFLAQRRGISKESALHLLGEWVLGYEPVNPALRARRVELEPALRRELNAPAP